jgi:serine/threonine protein phosphatase PrpC
MVPRSCERTGRAEAACTKLVAQANEAGSRDNVTVLIARFDPADLDRGDA